MLLQAAKSSSSGPAAGGAKGIGGPRAREASGHWAAQGADPATEGTGHEAVVALWYPISYVASSKLDHWQYVGVGVGASSKNPSCEGERRRRRWERARRVGGGETEAI